MAKRKNGKRTKSGRLSRTKEEIAIRRKEDERVTFENSPVQTVLQARYRCLKSFRQPEDCDNWRKRALRPVTKKEGEILARCGSVIDRIGILSEEEREAGRTHCQRYIVYAATSGLPTATPQAPSYGEVRGSTRPENIRRAIAAKEDYMIDDRILTRCSAGVKWAIKRACVLDEKAPEHLVKEGLRELTRKGR